MGYELDLPPMPWAATRDASSFARPDVRTAKRLHIADEDGNARCSGNPLNEFAWWRLADAPRTARCQRPGCRVHWQAFDHEQEDR